MSAISISSILPQPLSTVPTNPSIALQTYFKERRTEVKQLQEALQSGDLAAAQQAYSNIVALGNNVLHKDNPFLRSDRGLDFNAIGGALQNGDLDGAKQAFAALQNTFVHKPGGASSNASPSTIANLSNAGNANTADENGVNVIV